MRAIETSRPQVVIIDITLGGEDGIELIDYIKSRWPSMKMLVAADAVAGAAQRGDRAADLSRGKRSHFPVNWGRSGKLVGL